MQTELKKREGKKRKSFGTWFEDTGVTYAMLLPNFIMFLVFTLYPMLWTMRFMFYKYDGLLMAKFVGLDNFIRAFQDVYWWNSVLNTLKIAGMKLLIEIPLALILAVILNQKLRGRGLFRGVFFLPTVISMATISLAFSFMFSPYNGIVNNLLKELGVITQNVSFLEKPTSAFFTVVIISVWSVFGQNMLLILSGLVNIPEELNESAALDGANKLQIFWHITIPMILPLFKIILMLAIIGSLGIFDPVYLITNGGPQRATEVMALNIYNYYFSTSGGSGQYGYGAALSFLSSVIICLVTIVYNWIQKKCE